MEAVPADVLDEVRALIDACRARCLWFLREDYYPESAAETIRALERIQRHGDLDAFRRAGKLKEWLSRHSSDVSAS